MKNNFRVGDRVKINPKKSYNRYTEYALGKVYVIHDIFGIFGNPSGYPGNALLKEEEGDISGGFIESLEALELVEPAAGICEKEELRKEIHDKMKFPRDIANYCVNDVLTTMKAAETKNFYSLNVSKIIFNPPATIVFWEDGTKTVVKCAAEDEFNEYYGFLAALGKKVYENNNQIKKLIDKKAEWHENKKDKKDIPDDSVDSLTEALEYLCTGTFDRYDENNKKEDCRMDIEKAKAVKEILDNIEKIREFRSFYEKNRIKDVTVSITFQEDDIPKTATMRATNALRLGEESIQRIVRYILNGCDAEIKDLENQIGRM